MPSNAIAILFSGTLFCIVMAIRHGIAAGIVIFALFLVGASIYHEILENKNAAVAILVGAVLVCLTLAGIAWMLLQN